MTDPLAGALGRAMERAMGRLPTGIEPAGSLLRLAPMVRKALRAGNEAYMMHVTATFDPSHENLEDRLEQAHAAAETAFIHSLEEQTRG